MPSRALHSYSTSSSAFRTAQQEWRAHVNAVAPALLPSRTVVLPSSTSACKAGLEYPPVPMARARAQAGLAMQIRLKWATVAVMVLVSSLCVQSTEAGDLRYDYYQTSCPDAEMIVFDTLKQLATQDPDLYAVLVRLQFHDCGCNGCEASVLLNYPDAEMYAPPNARLEGYDAIETIKAALEAKCPGVVSCADILAYAARDSVKLSKGPNGEGWPVRGGRLDGRVSRKEDPEKQLPGAGMNANQLVENFAQKGLTKADMVALSGAHTIGESACKHIDNRIYYYPSKSGVDPNIPQDFAQKLKKKCREPGSMKRKFDLDGTSDLFDSNYYNMLAAKKGLLVSDQVLWDDMSTRSLVQENSNQDVFFKNFAKAWIKMSEINVITGPTGEIRRKCSHIN